MLILTIRTDKPEAEIGLFDHQAQLDYQSWQADRQLSNTLHRKIQAMLAAKGKDFPDIGGIVCFQGPGSFTGLRIGITVADALAYGLQIPIVGGKGEEWINQGIQRLQDGGDDRIVQPHYGAPVHITQQKK
jgi:tRNA threonylcarbamoyladenosine biosynthesis protein TsaB